MASQRFRDFRSVPSVTVLLPAFLTLNIALNAQNPPDTSKLRQSLGLANSKDVKSSANFNRMVTEQMSAANAAAFATAASATLPKFIAHRDYVAADVPVNVAMGDLNGDGISDLVVPTFNDSTKITVLLVKRDGRFEPLRPQQ